MNTQLLKETIKSIFQGQKGILAMDESMITCDKRFLAAGIDQTVEMRRRYRNLIISTTDLNQSIGGVILSDETIRQLTDDKKLLSDEVVNKGIILGIKVDMGTKPLAFFKNEKVTEGLDGLTERLFEYKKMGARFAKWRAVIAIGDEIPTLECINTNMHDLARYAAICQENDIVPIVEPEVLMDGNHSLIKCFQVTQLVLKTLFNALYNAKVDLEGIILKPNMVIEGLDNVNKSSVEQVAEATVRCFRSCVPSAVPAIAFLSGGQSPEQAAKHLNAIHKNFEDQLPWIVSFSFARAIQQPALDIWRGKNENVLRAQNMLSKRAKIAVAANRGKYTDVMEIAAI